MNNDDDDFFTLEEAESKVGRRVEALREIARTPPGGTGTVIETDQASEDGYYVVVQWDQASERRVFQFDTGEGETVTAVIGGRATRDYIRRDEYEKFLREV